MYMSTVTFSLVCMVVNAIHIELLSDDKPCSIKNPAILKCTYDLDARLPNGDSKYSSSQPSWRENGELILLTDPRYRIPSVPGLTSAMLHVNSTWEGPVEYSCFLLLNNGFDEEESNKLMVIHKDKPDTPKLNSQPVIMDNSITLQMTHNKTCFTKHNFFLDFNVTVNSEKMYNNRTSSIEEPITIQNLEPGTEHNFSVVAVCKQDGGVRSKLFTTTIKTTSVANKPDAPKINSQPVITDNSIKLQMTHNKTCFTKHNFFLDFNVTVNSEKMYNNRTSSIEEPITIQNLEPGTEHNISVVAVCKQDGGVRSNLFTTTIKTTNVINAGPTTIPEYAVILIAVCINAMLLCWYF